MSRYNCSDDSTPGSSSDSEERLRTRPSGSREWTQRSNQRGYQRIERPPSERHSRSHYDDSTEGYRRSGGHSPSGNRAGNRTSRAASSLEVNHQSRASSTRDNHGSSTQRSSYLIPEIRTPNERSGRRSADDRSERRPPTQPSDRSSRPRRDDRHQSSHRLIDTHDATTATQRRRRGQNEDNAIRYSREPAAVQNPNYERSRATRNVNHQYGLYDAEAARRYIQEWDINWDYPDYWHPNGNGGS